MAPQSVRTRTRAPAGEPGAAAPRQRSAGNVVLFKAERKETDPHVLALEAFSTPPESRTKADTSSKQLDDPYITQVDPAGSELQTIAPPYNLASLVRLPKESRILNQCIGAMVTNTVGHGWALHYIGPDGQEQSEAAKAEKTSLESLFNHPNEDMSTVEMLERIKADKETLGQGYMEVGRDAKRRVTLLSHVAGHTIRMTQRSSEAIEVEIKLLRDGVMTTMKVWRRFRLYRQQVGARTIYFKEFGDPRSIDPKTGKVDATLKIEDQATEIIMDAIYAPGESYGLPRWLGTMPSVLGSRQADLTNLDFFKDNAIPALAVLVSGGMLTKASFQQIETELTAIRGRKAMNRVVVLEADADPKAAGADGTLPPPKIDIKPLAGERQKDGVHLEYQKDSETTVRSAWRLPPIFTGHSSDYTLATAKTSFEVAESQVFGPERSKTCDMVNTKIVATYDAKFWAFRLQPARITDPEEVIKALEAFDQLGAMTPNLAIALANEYFDMEIPKIEEDWGDWPFAIVKELGVKGQLKGIEDIADIPEPPPALPPGAGLPGTPGTAPGAKPGAADNGANPKPTGTGAKGKTKPKEKPGTDDGKTEQKTQREALLGAVRRTLMDLKDLQAQVKETA